MSGKLAGVRRIGVLRPNAVGDFVFALPALHALKRAYPDAELVLLGLPWHAAFLAGRPGPVDRVVVVPPMPGIGLPPDAPDDGTTLRFSRAMQDQRFDIACQMYGGGMYSNPLVASFGARLSIGARAGGAPGLDRWVRHAEPGNRRLALLEVVALAGALEARLEQELAVTQADRDEADRVAPAAASGGVLQTGSAADPLASAGMPASAGDDDAGPVAPDTTPAPAAPVAAAARAAAVAPISAARAASLSMAAPVPMAAPVSMAEPAVTAAPAATAARQDQPSPDGRARSTRPLVLLQPGSTDPRRCWPAASFAAVGDALARMGAQVAVNGTAAEAPLVRRMIETMTAPAIDLSGKLGLGGLCGLIERAACVVSNDTGPLHLALAIGTPAVGIFWLTNLIDGTPLRQGLLRAALSLRQDCPTCGAVNLSSRCPHEASFVADVPVEQVVSLAADVLHESGAACLRWRV